MASSTRTQEKEIQEALGTEIYQFLKYLFLKMIFDNTMRYTSNGSYSKTNTIRKLFSREPFEVALWKTTDRFMTPNFFELLNKVMFVKVKHDYFMSILISTVTEIDLLKLQGDDRDVIELRLRHILLRYQKKMGILTKPIPENVYDGTFVYEDDKEEEDKREEDNEEEDKYEYEDEDNEEEDEALRFYDHFGSEEV